MNSLKWWLISNAGETIYTLEIAFFAALIYWRLA